MRKTTTRRDDAVGHGMVRWVLAVLVAVVAVVPALGAGRGEESEPQLKTILAKVREAVGYANLSRHGGVIMVEGEQKHYGVEGMYSLQFAPDGKFVKKITARLGSTTGFDGREAWSVDWSGLPSSLELEDMEIAIGSQWVFTWRWLADDGPFVITVNSKGTNSDQIVLDLRLDEGVLVWQLAIDRKSWLPASLSLRSKGGTDVWKMTDYGEFHGIKMACKVDHVDGAGKTSNVRISDVTMSPRGAGDPFKRVTKRPDDAHFDDSVPAELEVKVTPTGHLLVHPLVGGRDVGWFIFDTGAGAMVISPKVADAEKMDAFGEVTANGAGGRIMTRFRQGKSLRIGRVTLDDPIFVELDLSFLTPYFGVEVAGICGYDLLTRVVTEFDPYKRKISLLDPSSYKLAKGEWMELLVSERRPNVRARFEGEREGVFRLDTGASGTVAFHAPAVKRLGLLEGRETTSGVLGGAGGMKDVRAGTIEWFELAGHRFEQPVVTFGLSEEGAMSGHRSLGTIGLKFLEPFVVVFNYPAMTIAFVPR